MYMVCPNSWIDGEISGRFIAVPSESTRLHYCAVDRPDNGVSSLAALSFLITNLVQGQFPELE